MTDAERRRSAQIAQLSADEIKNRSFGKGVRGYSESEVRSFLHRISDDYARLDDRQRELAEKVDALTEALETPPALTESAILENLGPQTAKLLRAAQEAADEIRRLAEEKSSAQLDLAHDDARRFLDQAEADAAARIERAERAAQATELGAREKSDEIIRFAEIETAATRSSADAYASQLRGEAESEAEIVLEKARETGRELLAEARSVRERVLADFAKRKTLLAEQISELRQNREKLLDAYRIVKSTLSDATVALNQVENRAAKELNADEPLIPDWPSDETVLSGGSIAIAAEAEIKPPPSKSATNGSGIRDYVKDALGIGESTQTEVEESADEEDVLKLADIEREERAKAQAEIPGSEDTGPEETDGVDDLFARLKAQRATAVTSAKATVAAIAKSAGADVGTEEAAGENELEVHPAIRKRDKALEDLRKKLLRKAKRELQDEQNEVLDSLRKAKGKITASKILPGVGAHRQLWTDVATETIADAYMAGQKVNGGSRRPTNTVVAQFIDMLIVPLRERLDETIAMSSADELPAMINARYREWKGQELNTVVDDVLIAAHSLGVFDSTKDGEKLQWIPERPGVCADADDNALEQVIKGDKFPTGQVCPLAHPGCRCTISPPR